jgi:hypothetical protein
VSFHLIESFPINILSNIRINIYLSINVWKKNMRKYQVSHLIHINYIAFLYQYIDDSIYGVIDEDPV